MNRKEATINKVWTQSHREKMSGAIIKKVVNKVKEVWRAKKEKELEDESKKLLKKAKNCLVPICKAIIREFGRKADKKTLKKDILWMIQNHLKDDDINNRTLTYLNDEMSIPNVDWFNNNESAHIATNLCGNKIMVLHNLGFVILEFLRTGHIDEWLDVIELMETYEDNILKIKEDKSNV